MEKQVTQADASGMFLGIITSVEAGLMTPEEAMKEQECLNREARTKYNYRLHEFQAIREAALSEQEQDYDAAFYVDDSIDDDEDE